MKKSSMQEIGNSKEFSKDYFQISVQNLRGTSLSSTAISMTKVNDAQKNYYNTVKNVLQDNELYSKMKFNKNTNNLTSKQKKYLVPDRSKIPEYDLSQSKKSLNFSQQFDRKPDNYTLNNQFSADKYRYYHANKKEYTIPFIQQIKELDNKKVNDLSLTRERNKISQIYKIRENKGTVFDPPPKFNENREDYKNKTSLFGNNIFKSDVFSQGEVTKDFLKKSGENYAFNPSKKIYSSNIMSNSVWIPSHSNPSLFNHTNNEYHILNPLMKTISPVRSKVINNENKDIITHRQKSISEFVHITRNGSPNPNKDFVQTYKTYNSPFNVTKNLCSEFSLMSHYYKDLCGPAFTTKR